MDLESSARGSASRFAAYVEAITSALGHADRPTPFHSYCAGLLLPGDRKSVEPIAARVQPGRVQAAHQSNQHCPLRVVRGSARQAATASSVNHTVKLPR